MKLLLLAVVFCGVAFIGDSPMARAADDVTQTKTLINGEVIGGDLTQCIVQSNAITFKNAYTSADPTSFTFKDVTQTSTLSNSGAIGGELVQYIIHINGLTHNSRANFVERLAVNGDAAITLTGPARVGQDSTSVGSTSNVFRDVTQTSTLSNSGAITGDLIQYIIHINGMNTDQLQNIADSAGSEIIHQLLKKLVDKMSLNGI